MKRILIVDDSSNWLEYHFNQIKKYHGENVQLVMANSARKASQILSASIDEPFDVILTDMQMETDFLPLNAGEQVIKEIQSYSEYENTKIIIISAAYNIKELAAKYGVDFMPKSRCVDTSVYAGIIN